MRKRYLLLFQLALLPTLAAHAQFSAGTEGFNIASNTTVSIDGMFMTPTVALSLTSQTLSKVDDPIGNTPPGIKLVYRFTNSFNFSGLAGFYYTEDDLNSNSEGDLQLYYGSGNAFNATAGTTVEPDLNRLSNTLENVSFSALTAAQEGALPVILASFDLRRNENATILHWQTSTEKNSDHFEVQHSENGRTWKSLGKVLAARQSTTLISYSYTDPAKRQGTQYYRIKMVDKDGTFAYSPLRSILLDGSDKISTYPNPVLDRFYVNAGESVTRIRLTDLSGRKLLELTDPESGINLSSYPTGVYLAEITTQSGVNQVVKILKK